MPSRGECIRYFEPTRIHTRAMVPAHAGATTFMAACIHTPTGALLLLAIGLDYVELAIAIKCRVYKTIEPSLREFPVSALSNHPVCVRFPQRVHPSRGGGTFWHAHPKLFMKTITAKNDWNSSLFPDLRQSFFLHFDIPHLCHRRQVTHERYAPMVEHRNALPLELREIYLIPASRKIAS